MDDHIAALEAALAALPKVKAWKLAKRAPKSYSNGKVMHYVDGPETVPDYENWGFTEEAAAYIAAANPAVIESVLAEVKRLREELAASEARADMHADLGRRTAEALGLTPEEGRSHMPELAEALRADAGRLQWLLDHPLWSVSYRIRPGKAKEYRMREEGEYWGQWWPTGRQAIDKARAIKAAQAAKERT